MKFEECQRKPHRGDDNKQGMVDKSGKRNCRQQNLSSSFIFQVDN